MSADNITYCPRCLKKSLGHKCEGNYPPDIWEGMEGTTNSLREYHDLGVLPNGKFFVHYEGTCRDCGFAFKFEYELDLTTTFKDAGTLKHNKNTIDYVI